MCNLKYQIYVDRHFKWNQHINSYLGIYYGLVQFILSYDICTLGDLG